MLDANTKRKIDNCRDILVGKIPDPKSQVEQITIALIYKFMDDMDQESIYMGGKSSFFTGEFEKYSWSSIFSPRISGFELLNLYGEALVKMNHNQNIPQLFRDIFKNAFLPYRDPETLRLFLKEISGFTYDHSERLGDAFEYLLSVLGSQGEAGQFRTPRHIIDFIVKVVDPQLNQTVLDPACGTAGFLISAYKHILKNNPKLSVSQKQRLMNNFVGYDIDPGMRRLSLVNMYLHGFPQPNIDEYDTLTYEDHWQDTFDIIMANPPFMTPKGGIRPHSRFSIKSKRSELLFADYIVEHLNPGGKAGFIVPEGILFVENKAFEKFRRSIVANNYLYAIVSLPHGVFKPYASVKTHILFLDRRLASRSSSILFVDVESDGFTQTDTRQPIKENDIPFAVKVLIKYRQTLTLPSSSEHTPEFYLVSKKEILSRDKFPLIGRWYNIESKYPKSPSVPFKRLIDICDFWPGLSPNMKTLPGEFPLVTPAEDKKSADHYDYEEPTVCIPLISSSGHGKADVKRLHYQEGKFALSTTMIGLTPKTNSGVTARYLYQVFSDKKDFLIVPLMAGSTNVTLKQNLFENVRIPVPDSDIQREIVEHSAWCILAEKAAELYSHTEQDIDGEKAQEVVNLLEQVINQLRHHAEQKRTVEDVWK